MKAHFFKKYSEAIVVSILFLLLTCIYLWPLFQGLIILPLDLLVTTYAPWYSPGTILLKNPYMQDSIVQLFPWHHLTFQSLTNGIIPLWNPYQFLGMPFMANLKSMVFYPLNVFFIFGEIKAWNMLLFSQIFLGFIFSYMLGRELSLKKIPSILLALAFSLNSYMIGLLEFGSDAQTVIWWPLMLLCIKKYLDTKNYLYVVGFSVACSFSIFAGQLQYIGYFLIMIFGFVILYGRHVKAAYSSYVFLLTGLLLCLGLSALQLVPAIELFGFSHRGLLDSAQNFTVFSRGLMPIKDILRLLSPDFFGNPTTRDLSIAYIETSGYFGIVPLFFAIYAMIFERRNIIVRFFSISFLVSILLSLKGIGEVLYFLKIPLITSGSAERVFIITLFSGAILAGYGFSYFLLEKSYRKNLISLFIFFTGVVSLVVTYHFSNKDLTTFIHNVSFSLFILIGFLAFAIAYFLLKRLSKKGEILAFLFATCVIGITFFDLYRFGYRFLTFSNQKFLYPTTGVSTFLEHNSQTTLARTFGLAEPELSTYLHIYTVDTYNPLYLSQTALLLQAIQGKTKEKLNIDNKYNLTTDGANLKRSLDFLGVAYVVVGKFENPSVKYFHTHSFESSFKKVYEDDKYIVYQNIGALPRFGVYYKTKYFSTDSQMLQALSLWNTNDADTVYLESSLPTKIGNGTGSARLVSSSLNSGKFLVSSSAKGLLYISDTYFPGWHATVNGKEEEIYRAYYNFRGVIVPKGTSTVEFTYKPYSYTIGLLISIFSWGIAIGVALFSLKRINSK